MSQNENAGAASGAPRAEGSAARAASAGLGAVQSMTEQMAGWEREAYDRMKTAAHDAVRLYADALDYAASMAAQWRSFYLDAARRASDVSPR